MRFRAPIPYRRFVGDTEGLPKYPGEPVEQLSPAKGVSSPPKERRVGWLLAGGWALMSISLAGIFRNPWVGMLALSVGVMLAGAAEIYDHIDSNGGSGK